MTAVVHVPTVERLFKIRPGEGRKILQFALLSGLLQAGVAVGMSAGDALFLTQIGVSQLPLVYISMPLLLAVYVPAVTLMVARYGIERTLVSVLGVLILGGVAFFGALALGEPPPWVFYAIKFYAALWYIGLYTLFWNFVDRFFDMQDGKRLFALFSAGGAAGAVVGGGLVGLLSQGSTLGLLFLLWAILSAAAIPLALRIGRQFTALDEESEDEVSPPPIGEQLRKTGQTLRSSRYVGMFALTLVGVLFATSLVEFQYLSIFSEGASDRELALLFGILFAAANLLNLFINLFVFNRLVLTVGVQNVVLIQPVVYLGVFALLLLQGGMLAAVAGFFAYHTILTSIDYNNQNLLFNGVPASVKKEVRTVVEGMAEPLATALAGFFLLAFAATMAPQTLSFVGFVLAAVCFVLALVLRSQFGKAMVANLKEGWLDLAQPIHQVLGGLTDEDLARVRSEAEQTDPKRALPALRMLWEIQPREAQPRTLAFFQAADDQARTEALPLIERLVREGDLDWVRGLLEWVQQANQDLDPDLMALLGSHGLLSATSRFLVENTDGEGRDPETQAAALVPLWNSPRAADRRTASHLLDRLLSGTEPEILAGLLAVGRVQDEPLAAEASRFLTHPSSQVRERALWALSRSVGSGSAGLVPVILKAIARGGDVEGQWGLEAMRRIGDPASISRLLGLAEILSPALRRQVAQVVQGVGFKGVPVVVATLRDPASSHASRSLAARVLARVAFPQLEALTPELIDSELKRANRTQDTAQKVREILALLSESQAIAETGTGGLAAHPDTHLLLGLLARFHDEKRDGTVDFVLQLLSLGGRLPDFELLAASLRSTSSRDRANALETLEQGVPRPVFRALVPLLMGSSDLERVSESLAPKGSVAGRLEGILLEALNSPQALEAAIAAALLRRSEDPLIREALRERLGRPHHPVLRDLILLSGTSDSVNALIPNFLALAEAPFYRTLPLAELLAIARDPSAQNGEDPLAMARRRAGVSANVAVELLRYRLRSAYA